MINCIIICSQENQQSTGNIQKLVTSPNQLKTMSHSNSDTALLQTGDGGTNLDQNSDEKSGMNGETEEKDQRVCNFVCESHFLRSMYYKQMSLKWNFEKYRDVTFYHSFDLPHYEVIICNFVVFPVTTSSYGDISME